MTDVMPISPIYCFPANNCYRRVPSLGPIITPPLFFLNMFYCKLFSNALWKFPAKFSEVDDLLPILRAKKVHGKLFVFSSIICLVAFMFLLEVVLIMTSNDKLLLLEFNPCVGGIKFMVRISFVFMCTVLHLGSLFVEHLEFR